MEAGGALASTGGALRLPSAFLSFSSANPLAHFDPDSAFVYLVYASVYWKKDDHPLQRPLFRITTLRCERICGHRVWAQHAWRLEDSLRLSKKSSNRHD